MTHKERYQTNPEYRERMKALSRAWHERHPDYNKEYKRKLTDRMRAEKPEKTVPSWSILNTHLYDNGTKRST